MMGSRASETPATTGSDDVTSPYHVPAELMPVVTSLTSPERRYLPLWYLYDTRGSELCEEMIQTSKSYKLWKHEYSILQTHADDIASKVSSPAVLVDLGSAASSKTRLIIEAMLKRHAVTFVPVDTAKEFIETCGRQLERDYPGLTVEPFGGFYMDGVRHSAARSGIKLLLFLGSSLGNVSIREQLKMLQEIRAQLTDQDRFILGVDMNTDRETLSQAYGDQWIPIWRDNLISRLNMDFGGDMNHEMFAFNFDFVENSADGDTPSYVQLSLSSSGKQRVHFEKLGIDIDFRDDERIHFNEGPNTSCKWNMKQLHSLAERSGFAVDAQWTNDEDNYCVICLAPAGVSKPTV
ncbi:Hypp3181 [Branchiostoma lanceolatum]|uniref:Hypp3181 protein n=1 Tax=Branchiostoma lanceolatum TaxID=7740 RepID=A0A8K0A0E0_BRALA|nr:Hypp3181 [Branchiostoma lanceolatum]